MQPQSIHLILAAMTLALITLIGCEPQSTAKADTPSDVEHRAAAIEQLSSRPVPPTLVDVYFPDSKFGTCGEPIAICAEAESNDESPAKFEWQQTVPKSPYAILTVTDSVREGRRLTECVAFTPTTEQTALEIRALRSDGVPGPSDDKPMYLYDSITVPIYATGAACGEDES